MLPFYVFLLLAGTGLALAPPLATTDETDTDTPLDPEEPTDPEEPVDPDAPILVGDISNATVAGTDGDDTFALTPETLTADDPDIFLSQLDAGAGDDVINLLDPNAALPPVASVDPTLFGGSVDGGEGNDTISVTAQYASILGSTGDDAITVFGGNGSTVDGGADNDTITVEAFSGDPVTIMGGAGDDLIDATSVDNGQILGGIGNDTIIVAGQNQGGAGYVVAPDGGQGDDLIWYDDDPNFAPFIAEIFDASTVTGGSGEDVFQITFTEGSALDAVDDAEVPEGTTILSHELVVIGDFVSGSDLIVLDPSVANDAYTLGELMIEEDTALGLTQIIIPFDSDTEIDREVVITVNAVGLTQDDVVFADRA